MRAFTAIAMSLFVGACSSTGLLAGTGGESGGHGGGGSHGGSGGRGAGTGGTGGRPSTPPVGGFGGSFNPDTPSTGTGGAGGAVSPPGTGGAPAEPVPGGVPTEGIPDEVAAILRARCSACHTYGQGDLAGWGSALDLSRMIDAEIVVPGDPASSRMIDRVAVRGDMPLRGDRVPPAEIDTLKRWITNLRRPVSSPRDDLAILDAINADLLSVRSMSTDFRYISFAHFADQGRPASEVTAARNVLELVMNSLSRRGNLVQMAPIDTQQSIFRFRLSDLGWSAALWDQLTSFYPYCLASNVTGHQAMYRQLGTEAPFVRGDWLIDTATRAPLYDLLVDLPATLNDLGTRLGVNIANDINHPGQAEPNNLVRFALRRSSVALHNRVAERHLGNSGQFLWVTYDFRNDNGTGDAFANPLGPRSVDRQGFTHTFVNDSGEAIFTTANGMLGFMLFNGAGQKIAVTDTVVAKDNHRRTGLLENGISCLGCHAPNGMIRPVDTNEMADFLNTHVSAFQIREFDEISALYPAVLMPDVLKTDGTRYRGSVASLAGGGPDPSRNEWLELVWSAGDYESNLGFRGAAAEFNDDPATFRQRVLANDFDNRTLPRDTSEPLITRDDFVCAWRALAPKIRPLRFCAKTFNAAAVAGLCR